MMIEGQAVFRWRTALIADPQPVFRLGLVALLASAHPDWDVVESDTVEEHRLRPSRRPVDILILEGRLLVAQLEKNNPVQMLTNLADSVVAVTEPGDAVGALGCLAAGAHATISRADPANRMLETIETTMIQRQRAGASPPPAEESLEILTLTNRQMDVLRLLAKGQSNKVIARDLGLSVSTVKVHLNTVFRALGASNRLEAVVRARPFHTRMASQNH